MKTINHYLEVTKDLRATDYLIVNYEKPSDASNARVRGLSLSEIKKGVGWEDKPMYRTFCYKNTLEIVYEYIVCITGNFIVFF